MPDRQSLFATQNARNKAVRKCILKPNTTKTRVLHCHQHTCVNQYAMPAMPPARIERASPHVDGHHPL